MTKQATCDTAGHGLAGEVQLRNTTGSAVNWTAGAKEQKQGKPWASVSPPSGSTLAGAKSSFAVTPSDAVCKQGDPPTTAHVEITYNGKTTTVAFTVYPNTG